MSLRNAAISYSQRTIIDLFTTNVTGFSFQMKNKNIKKSVSPSENTPPLNSYLFQPYESTWSAIKPADRDLKTWKKEKSQRKPQMPFLPISVSKYMHNNITERQENFSYSGNGLQNILKIMEHTPIHPKF